MFGHVVTPSSLVGRTVDGRYRLEERLGTGTYGVTYRARHIEHQRIVALKLMHEHVSGSASLRASFESEAMQLARVEHPSIVTLVKYGEHAGQSWVACEWLEGDTLAAQLERGGLPLGVALSIVRQLLAALASAHAARLIHRNVKPSNVILERRSAQGRERVKLVDFAPALATLPAPLVASMVTPFSPPELVAGEPLDARSDVFGVGATLIGMLNGSERDANDNAASAPRGLTGMHARALPGVDASLVTWIRRATSVHRTMRFADAADALRELIDLLPRDVRSSYALGDAASGARASVESRPARPTTRPVAPLPRLPSMSRSEIPPPPSRAPARIEVPKVAPVPSATGLDAANDQTRLATPAAAAAEEPTRHEPSESASFEIEPLIPLAARAESARGTLRPIERRITGAIAEPRLVPLMAAGVFAFLIVALGVFLHGKGRTTNTQRSASAPAEVDDARRLARMDTAKPSSAPGVHPRAPALVVIPVPEVEPSTSTNTGRNTPPEPITTAPLTTSAARAQNTLIVAAPGRPAVRNPWQEPAPQMLKRWHELAMNGAPGGEGTVKAIREYNRDHQNDVRGNLVIAQLYLNRFWRTDCVEEFGTALDRDPTVRGAPEVLPALLDMVAQGKVPALAQRLILKAYGTEALDPIDQAFAEVKNPDFAARLHALRLKIMELSPSR